VTTVADVNHPNRRRIPAFPDRRVYDTNAAASRAALPPPPRRTQQASLRPRASPSSPTRPNSQPDRGAYAKSDRAAKGQSTAPDLGQLACWRHGFRPDAIRSLAE
jgi:hypothetical protein